MNKIKSLVGIIMLVCLILPVTVFASAVKTFSGTVISISGSQVIISTTSAAKYSAEVGNAHLTRKNGVVMKFSEILVGDKVEVKGTLWPDNSISVTNLKDNSLYAHTGTFTGKVVSINPPDSSFVMQSKNYGNQTIITNNFTSFTKNGSGTGFKDVELGMTATVKGVWDRNNTTVTAASIAGTLRMISIYFTGSLSIKSDGALTVIGNGNVIYGVEISHAAILNKSGKPASLSQYNLGDSLRVWGKHISGMVAVVASEVRDVNVVK